MTRKIKLGKHELRSSCPISAALDLIGDKWSLLLIRDMGMRSRHRYKEFQEGAEGIPTNILASRLKRLVKLGIVEKRLYQKNPPRSEYFLTPIGESLTPILKHLAQWSADHINCVKIPKQFKGS